MGISVIIPNYNGRHLLERNLPKLYTALENSGLPYEVIVSDDRSTDTSVDFLRRNYPAIILVESPVNSGFSINVNRGMARATLELVLILNSDIVLSEHYFRDQLACFRLPDTFGTMGRIIDAADGTVSEACKVPIKKTIKVNAVRDRIPPANRGPVFSYYLSGANALVNRERLMQLQGFNPLYSPFYHEDLDLSLRAWQLGWKCYYVDSSACTHAVSSTIRTYRSRQQIRAIATRNKLLLHYFHLEPAERAVWWTRLLLSLTVRWLIGQYAYYRAFGSFLRRKAAMAHARTAFREQRAAAAGPTLSEVRRIVCGNQEKSGIQ